MITCTVKLSLIQGGDTFEVKSQASTKSKIL